MVVRKNFRPDPRKDFNQLSDDVLLDVDETAGVLGVSRFTVKGWRAKGLGPRAVVLGQRAIRFRVGDIRAWVAGQRKAS